MESMRRTSQFPALTSLGVTGDDLAALARQGTLRAEQSSPGKYYYKLRFRVGSKQQVRYVGNQPGFVEQVRGELTRLQMRRRSNRQLHRLLREANECLRQTKRRLKPVLSRAGLCFYGREIRRQSGRDGTCVDGHETVE